MLNIFYIKNFTIYKKKKNNQKQFYTKLILKLDYNII